MGRTANGTGSTRQLEDGSWECVISSKYINPKTGKTKRIKRKGKTESEARKNARMATDAWEKDFERGKDTKINKRKTFGAYMNDYIEEEVKPNITASGYLTYVSNMKNNFDNFPIARLQLHMLSSVEFENYFNSILALKSKKTCSLPIQLCRRCDRTNQYSLCTGHRRCKTACHRLQQQRNSLSRQHRRPDWKKQQRRLRLYARHSGRRTRPRAHL